MNFAIGITLVLGSVLGGFAAMGGNLGVLWQPWEIVIIVGAAIGAYIISNTRAVILDTGKALKQLFTGSEYNKASYLDLFALLYTTFRIGKDGLRKWEKDFDDPDNSTFFNQFKEVKKNPKNARYIAEYLRLILLGAENTHEIEALIDEEIDGIEREYMRVPNALATIADALPALGIVAAVLGIIKAMSAINEPPEVLGYLIGGALVGTFLGVFLSYGVVGPLAQIIRTQRSQELAYYVAVKSSLLAFLNNYPPVVCVEHGRKVVSPDLRPTFDEVERMTQAVAAASGVALR